MEYMTTLNNHELAAARTLTEFAQGLAGLVEALQRAESLLACAFNPNIGEDGILSIGIGDAQQCVNQARAAIAKATL